MTYFTSCYNRKNVSQKNINIDTGKEYYKMF